LEAGGAGKSTDDVAVLMDVTQPLETLRKLVEAQLHCSLDKFELWLQDTMKVHIRVFSSVRPLQAPEL